MYINSIVTKNGNAAKARFNLPSGLAVLPDGRVLVAKEGSNRIRVISADLQRVKTVAGDGEQGHRDGQAAQARFYGPSGLAVLPDGRVLVADTGNNRIRQLSADLKEVSSVVGSFYYPSQLAALADDLVLVLDRWGVWVLNLRDNSKTEFDFDLRGKTVHSISVRDRRVLVATSAHLHTYAYGLWPFAKMPRPVEFTDIIQTQPWRVETMLILKDNRVLIADHGNKRLLLLSSNLRGWSKPVAFMQFSKPTGLAVLHDGRVLVAEKGASIREISADLRTVHTVVEYARLNNPSSLAVLSDGSVLVAYSGNNRIKVISADRKGVYSVAGAGARPQPPPPWSRCAAR